MANVTPTASQPKSTPSLAKASVPAAQPAASSAEQQYKVRQRPVAAKVPGPDAPVIKLTVDEMDDEFQRGLDADKFADRWVEIAGLLNDLRVDFPWEDISSREAVLYLMLEGETRETAAMTCFMKAGERPWEQASKRDRVVVRGVFVKQGTRGHLLECQIVKSGTPMLNVTVDELDERHQADPATFRMKYESQFIIVTGKYAGRLPPKLATEDKDEAKNWIALDGAKGRRLFARVDIDYFFSKVVEGQLVSVVGTFDGIPPDEPFVERPFYRAQNLTPFAPKTADK